MYHYVEDGFIEVELCQHIKKGALFSLPPEERPHYDLSKRDRGIRLRMCDPCWRMLEQGFFPLITGRAWRKADVPFG